MVRVLVSTSLIVVISLPASVFAQSVSFERFDVVSIKRNILGPEAGGGMRTLPDGTLVMTNQPIRSIIMSASPVPAREVVGLPDWAMTERYDVTVKPPAGSTREQRRQMWQTLLAERMKVVAHVEEREQDTFALVLARADGRLGPQLERSTLDCNPRPPASPPPPPQPTPTASDMRSRCGMMMGPTSIVSGGMTMAQFVQSLGGIAGRLVNDRTGLEGFYAFTLTFSARTLKASPDPALIDDAPEIFTALQEQLGLKLQPEDTMVPVLVIDHIERPSEN
jgi:uncharacterized protein (TIGR03435 family)